MKVKNKRVLITGELGFIGSHIVERSLKEGAEEVIIYDKFCTGNKQNIQSIDQSSKVKIIKGDILDYKKLEKAMKGAEIVSHHAAELGVFTAGIALQIYI